MMREAYIPMASPEQRARSLKIWGEAVARLSERDAEAGNAPETNPE